MRKKTLSTATALTTAVVLNPCDGCPDKSPLAFMGTIYKADQARAPPLLAFALEVVRAGIIFIHSGLFPPSGEFKTVPQTRCPFKKENAEHHNRAHTSHPQ